MTAIITLLTVVAVSLLITRIATLALVSTGLSKESARFQARSAFSGSGFTTSESENVVGHPVRRRVIMLLMLLGNAGIVTAVSTMILSFVGAQTARDWAPRLVLLVAGLGALWAIAASRLVDRWLNKAIGWALDRWTDLDVTDYAGLLHLGGDYRVVEMHVDPGDWMEDRRLDDLRLSEEGILVLGVERPGTSYAGTPRGRAVPRAGDTLILYGRANALQELDRRCAGPEGDAAHLRASAEQEVIEEVEEQALEEGEEEEKKEAEEAEAPQPRV